MRRLTRGAFIVWIVFRYGLDEMVLSSFKKPWLNMVTRILSIGRNLSAPRGQRLRQALGADIRQIWSGPFYPTRPDAAGHR